ncbi:hypothetical protein [Streptomyces murinus]|uniref:hypothetical protein n=1 Tax=Streptomyces murinus TaxID=33900 RepID=UPI003F46B67F
MTWTKPGFNVLEYVTITKDTRSGDRSSRSAASSRPPGTPQRAGFLNWTGSRHSPRPGARNHMARTPDRKLPRPAAQPSGAATHSR